MPRIKDVTKVASIYKAALKLLQRYGFTEMTMASVAAQAGIATGSIYTYFKNKEDLINKLFIDIKTEMFRNMLNALTASNTFESNFKKMWMWYFRFSTKEPQKLIFIDQFNNSGYLTLATRKKTMLMMQPILQLFEEANKKNWIREMDPLLLVSHFTGAINETIKMHQLIKAKPSAITIDSCYAICWNGIKPESKRIKNRRPMFVH